MNKTFFYTAVMLLTSLLLYSSSAMAETSEESLLSALALNYCRDSLVKIREYNDRIVLDEEYQNIINNIDLSKIQDKEIIYLLEDLMDTLSFFIIQEGERDKFNRIHEKKVKRAFYDAFSGSQSIIFAGGGNPFAMASLAVVQVGGAYGNYRSNMEEYREQLDNSLWELKKEAINQINEIQKSFLRKSWVLMKKHDIPDTWRLTDSQLKKYVEILKDNDASKKERRLKRISHEFEAYPPYWYYRGVTSIENKDDKNTSLAYFDKFKEIRRGFFRKDKIYTSALINEISLLDSKKDREKILYLLDLVIKNNDQDGQKNIYAALKYAELGHYDNARELLQINIDDGLNASLSSQLIANIHLIKGDKKSFNNSIESMLNSDRIKNQDILFLVGDIQEEKYLNRIRQQIIDVNIIVEESFGKDGIKLFIPIKWIVDGSEVKSNHMIVMDRQFSPISIKGESLNDGIFYYFEDTYNFDDLFESESVIPVSVKISTISGETSINGMITESCEEKEKSDLDKKIDSSLSWLARQTESVARKLGKDDGIDYNKDELESGKKSVCNYDFIKTTIDTESGQYSISPEGNIKKIDGSDI